MDPSYNVPTLIRRYVDAKGVKHSVVEDGQGVGNFIELDGHHADLFTPAPYENDGRKKSKK